MADHLMKFGEFHQDSDGFLVVGDYRFAMSLVDFTQVTTENEIVLLKSIETLNFYKELFSGKPIRNILEYGTWEGGSPIFLAAATNAQKIVGIDIREPSSAILKHAATFGNRLTLAYETSQADRAKVNAIMDKSFDGAVDVVIDDASHQYELTKGAFEIAFAKLRVGGYYIIEDWNWAHYENRHYDEYWADQRALSNLVMQLALAVGSIGPIKSMNVMNWGVVVEKGAEVDPNFRLEDLIRMGPNRRYTLY